MYRIQHQHEEHCQLAMRALLWISKAERPLQVEELQHAMAVELGDEDVEDGPLESATLIVSVCAGLVTIDAESKTFRLVHFSVQEYFEKKHYKWFPDADRVIAETCLTYLSFDAFAQEIFQDEYQYLRSLCQYPLFSYAAEDWGCHVNRSRPGLEEVKDVALKFLGNERKVAAAMQAMRQMRGHRFMPYRYAYKERVPGIHLVVAAQCLGFASAWKSCVGNIDTKNPTDGRTALQLAIMLEDLEMTRCLLDAGADVNESSNDGWTALMNAAHLALFEIVKLLLERGADPNVKNDLQCSCLYYAVSGPDARDFALEARCGCVGLLLKAGADIEARDASGNTPLSSVLRTGDFYIGKYLLQQGASVDVANSTGETPLFFALQGYDSVQLVNAIEMVELLLQSGADLNAVDCHGITALQQAAENTHRYAVIELLAQSGAKANLTGMDGRTDLMTTSRGCDDEKSIHLLLQSGVDVNAADHRGCTALMEAVRNQWCGCRATELLLQFGADVNAIDEKGETALTKVVQECFGLSNIMYLYYRYRGLWHDVKQKTNATADNVDREVSRILRERYRNILSALLSWGVSEQNRRKTLDWALSHRDPNQEIVKMLLAEESDGTSEEKVPLCQDA